MPVFNFLISGLVAYPFHQAVQLIGSTTIKSHLSIFIPYNSNSLIICTDQIFHQYDGFVKRFFLATLPCVTY